MKRPLYESGQAAPAADLDAALRSSQPDRTRPRPRWRRRGFLGILVGLGLIIALLAMDQRLPRDVSSSVVPITWEPQRFPQAYPAQLDQCRAQIRAATPGLPDSPLALERCMTEWMERGTTR